MAPARAKPRNPGQGCKSLCADPCTRHCRAAWQRLGQAVGSPTETLQAARIGVGGDAEYCEDGPIRRSKSRNRARCTGGGERASGQTRRISQALAVRQTASCPLRRWGRAGRFDGAIVGNCGARWALILLRRSVGVVTSGFHVALAVRGGARGVRNRIAPGWPMLFHGLGSGQQILAGEHAADRVVLTQDGQMPQAHRAEELVAPQRASVLLDGVAAPVGVWQQVEALLVVLWGKLGPHLRHRRRLRVATPQHLDEGDDPSLGAGRVSGRVDEGAEVPAQLQHPGERVGLDEPQESIGARLHNGEGVVPRAREQVDDVLHAGRGRQAPDLRRHALVGLQDDHVLLGAVLQEWHRAEVDVHVVDALTEEVARPLRGHHSREDRHSPLGLACGLHENDGQGDGDAGHARQHCCGTDHGIDAWVPSDDAAVINGLAKNSPRHSAAEQGRHKEAAGDTKAVCEDILGKVCDREERQHAHLHAVFAVEELLDGVPTDVHEKALCVRERVHVSCPTTCQGREKVEGDDRRGHQHDLDEADVPPGADVPHAPPREAGVQRVEERATEAAADAHHGEDGQFPDLVPALGGEAAELHRDLCAEGSPRGLALHGPVEEAHSEGGQGGADEGPHQDRGVHVRRALLDGEEHAADRRAEGGGDAGCGSSALLAAREPGRDAADDADDLAGE
eukprot:CAMPEP_0176201538 /NCGR_PEP_ID=MMETSP0121_2-20121125/9617_1 /TAXON_ID=160619 /ORGANISM="Kryptoperidinium foliaceum, Strain CCMP 1326" /LENGTH=678 /DNA_ID=CAMNT_0017540417 /DNA_START=32 /DNA_END=2066 /DNA_ORIENTATION=+